LNISASVGFVIGKENTTLGLLITYVENKTRLWNASFSFVSPSVRARETTLMLMDSYSYKTL